jgi:hypothetical protein
VQIVLPEAPLKYVLLQFQHHRPQGGSLGGRELMRPICHLSEMVRVNPNPNPKHGPDPNSNLNPKPTLPVRRVGLQCQDTYFPQDEMAHVVFKIIGKIIFHKAKLRGHLFSLGSNKFAGTTWRNKK